MSSKQGVVLAISVQWTRRGSSCPYLVDKAWSELSRTLSSEHGVVTAVSDSVRWTRRGHSCLCVCPMDKAWSQLSLTLSSEQGVVTAVSDSVQ